MRTLSGRKSDAHEGGIEPLRRPRGAPAPRAVVGRRTIHLVLIFACVVLVVDALVGEKGFVEALKARRQHRDEARSLEDLRRENGRLREVVRQLNEDPSAIEALARKNLGLIKPGEVLFIVKDAKPAR